MAEIDVSITGEARQLISQLDAASVAAQRLLAELQKFEASGVRGAQASTAIAILREQIDATRVSVAGLGAAAGGAAQATAALTNEVNIAEQAHMSLGRTIQHITAIIDGAMRGQRGQMMASTTALVRDSGLMQNAITALAGPWGVVAAAGVAALGAIGYALEQYTQRLRSIRDTQLSLATIGFGTSSTIGGAAFDPAASFDKARASTNEWIGTEKNLQAELDKLPPAAQASREAVEALAKSYSGLTGLDPKKFIEEFTKAAHQSPAAVAEFITKMFGLQAQVDKSGKSLIDIVKTISGFENAIKAAVGTELISQKLQQTGTSARKAEQDIWSFSAAMIIAFADRDVIDLGSNFVKLTNAIDQYLNPLRNVTLESQNLTAAQQAQNSAMIEGNEPLVKRTQLLNTLAAAEAGLIQARTSGPVTGATRPTGRGEIVPIPPPIVPATPEQIAARQNAVANERARVETSPLQPGEENASRRELAAIHEQADARKADLQAQLDAAEKILALRQRESVLRNTNDQGVYTPPKDISVAEIEAANAVARAKRAIEDQTNTLAIDNLRARIAEEQRGTQARLNDQLSIIAIYQRGVDAQRRTPVELAAEWTKYFGMVRQLRLRDFQDAQTKWREEVDLAKGNVDLILAASARLRVAAAAAGNPPAARNNDRETISALERAQAEKFSAVMSYESAVEKLDAAQISAFKANRQAEVATHAISKTTAEAREAQYTAYLLAGEEQRTAAMLRTVGLTEAQQQKLYEHLFELYAKDAELQTQHQAKITQAIESENAKRTKSFETMFNAVGSGFEKLIENAFTKQQTSAQALQGFGQTIFKSILTEVGHLASQGIGEKIAPMLGVETKGMTDTGIGAILGRALGNAFGITKAVPQDAMQGAAEKWTAAVSAQEAATKLSSTAFQDLSKAGQAIQQAAERLGSGATSGGGGTASSLVTANTAELQKLNALLNVASKDLPEGYTARMRSGFREGATVAYSGKPSEHSVGHAADIEILDPAGQRVPGYMGAGGPLYSQLDAAMLKARNQLYPGEPLAVGSTFGKPDAGHYSIGGQEAVTNSLKRGDTADQAQLSAGITQLHTVILDDVTVTAASTAQGQKDAQSVDAQKTATDAQKTAVTQNTQALQQSTQKASGDWSPRSNASSTSLSGGLSVLTQGIGIAASAAALFGGHLSTTARTILGAVGVISQLVSFGKNLGSVFDLVGTAVKAAHAVETAFTVVKLVGETTEVAHTAAVLTDTTATAAHAAAMAAGGAAGGGGGIFGLLGKAIGFGISLFAPEVGIPLELATSAATLSRGGIIPSAAGGMLAGGGTMAILHPKEMVLPAPISEGLQNMIGSNSSGGNTTNAPVLNFNANTTGYDPFGTSGGAERFFRQHSDVMMSHLSNLARNGWRPA